MKLTVDDKTYLLEMLDREIETIKKIQLDGTLSVDVCYRLNRRVSRLITAANEIEIIGGTNEGKY